MGVFGKRKPKQTSDYFDVGEHVRGNPDCTYYLFIGQRSNGKTYSAIKYLLEDYVKYGRRFAYIRRWKTDMTAALTKDTWTKSKAYLSTLTNGEWDFVDYYAGIFYLAKRDDKGKTIRGPIIGWAMPIDDVERRKGPEFEDCYNVLFDEFVARNGAYCVNEFAGFANALSTVLRSRENGKIIMCGNTLSKDSIYFHEMGLTNVSNMIPGDTAIYRYPRQYTDPDTRELKSYEMTLYLCMCDQRLAQPGALAYYAFDNARLRMIDGGYWEIGEYPHYRGNRVRPSDIVFTCFFQSNRIMIQCDIASTDDGVFALLHPKTTDLQHPDDDLIFACHYDPRPNWVYNFLAPSHYPAHRRIYNLYRAGKFFFSDNETGEEFASFISDCRNIRR